MPKDLPLNSLGFAKPPADTRVVVAMSGGVDSSVVAAKLAEEGYDAKMGARPLGRVIQENIKKPLAEELLFGKLSKGGVVQVGVKDGKIDLRIDGPGQKRLSGDKPPLLTAE